MPLVIDSNVPGALPHTSRLSTHVWIVQDVLNVTQAFIPIQEITARQWCGKPSLVTVECI
jgi:hypothetical protein